MRRYLDGFGRPLGGSSGRYKRKDMEQSSKEILRKKLKILSTVRTELGSVRI